MVMTIPDKYPKVTQVCFLVETFSTFDVKELLTFKDPTLEFLLLM